MTNDWKIASEVLPEIGKKVDVKILSYAMGTRTGESNFLLDESGMTTSTVIAWKNTDVKDENIELQRAEQG
jgi:hypothetical protein